MTDLPFVNVEESPEIAFNEYPVGFLFVSKSPITPDERGLKGDWEAIPAEHAIIGAGTVDETGLIYEAESTGGEAIHLLTKNEMPAHNHEQKIGLTGATAQTMAADYGSASGYAVKYDNTTVLNGTGEVVTTFYSGGSQAHNNMPPYVAYYMWIRIA